MLHITTTTGDLARAIGLAAHVVQARGTIPVLTHVLVAAEHGAIRLQATDIDQHLTLDLPGTAATDGAATFAVNKAMVALLATQPALADAAIAAGEKRSIRLSAGALALSDTGHPPGDFPAFWWGETVAEFKVHASALRHMLRLVRHAISSEETRYYLNGVYLHRAGDALRAVATDGHRMALRDTEAPEGLPPTFGEIVPRDAVATLAALLDDAVGMVTVRQSKEKKSDRGPLEFSMPGWSLRTKTIDGVYPEYEKAIAKGPDPAAKGAARVTIRDGARLAALFKTLKQKRRVVGATHLAQAGDGGLRLGLRAAALAGEGRAEILLPPEVATWEGPAGPDDHGFQAAYLSDLCELLGAFTLTPNPAPSGPALVEAAGFRGLLMPMRW